MEPALGRDRDPFDRTVAFMRERIATLAPLQGAVISISGLAASLDVSHTPVREALATLAGEGLIVRKAAGYAGATHDLASLAQLYDLAELLAVRAVAALPSEPLDLGAAPSLEAAIGQVVDAAGPGALGQAFRRVAAQLTPFTKAARLALGDETLALSRLTTAFATGDRRARSVAVRGPLQRRRRAAGRILTVALGLNGRRRI